MPPSKAKARGKTRLMARAVMGEVGWNPSNISRRRKEGQDDLDRLINIDYIISFSARFRLCVITTTANYWSNEDDDRLGTSEDKLRLTVKCRSRLPNNKDCSKIAVAGDNNRERAYGCEMRLRNGKMWTLTKPPKAERERRALKSLNAKHEYTDSRPLSHSGIVHNKYPVILFLILKLYGTGSHCDSRYISSSTRCGPKRIKGSRGKKGIAA